MMSRRIFLGGTAVAGVLAATGLLSRVGKADAAEGEFEIVKSEAEWKKQLTPEQYYVLREEGTERAGTSPLNKEKRAGTYHCAACDLALFSSETKYESGTGWPSFYAPLENAVGTSEDRSFFMTRTEVHCRRCGGHLGHVFDDGPPPTGKRYCMNGVAMTFESAGAA
ncbi:MAG: peptide-methionine (R)-S-oxide reductase MsrB [Parvibaculum sp.]|uniref:peptide-methionine (R)-S-oxide reductase MsrB n=1 Tax=Parvibaculum sp. TaxID=2024848 RepID=UPI003267F03D